MSIESINSKLVSVLHMDDDAWVDDKGSNHGTPTGGPLFSNTSPAPLLGTQSGDFDASDDKVSTGNTGLDKDQGAFHFLFAPSRAGGDNQNWIPFVWGTQSAFGNRVLFIKRASGNVFTFEINTASANPGLDVSGWAADSVHQIIGAWDNGTQKLYIDGVLINTLSYTPISAERLNVFINGDSSLKGGGMFDEVGYFNDALTDGSVSDGQTAGGEIAEIYNNGNYLVLNEEVVPSGLHRKGLGRGLNRGLGRGL
ncbi:hypothetical protein KAR91_63145 [Candidatus Pacearchaeota archaeon]|nr:hypothetical protein [Candidatus Pacearchaeota archaeon]